MNWIITAIEEAQQIPKSEIIKIKEKPQPGDIVVGAVPISLQKFRTVIEKRIDEVREVIKEHLKKHDDPEYDGGECYEFYKYFQKETSKINILIEIFWFELKESISYRPRKENTALGIRRGWSVVEFEDQESFDLIEELLKDLAGLDFHNDLFRFRPGSKN